MPRGAARRRPAEEFAMSSSADRPGHPGRRQFFSPGFIRWTIVSLVAGVFFLPSTRCGGSPETPESGILSSQYCLQRAHFGDPAQSPYILPYRAGESYQLYQSYCGPYTHQFQLAYDFIMPIGTPVIAARAGVVVRVVDLYDASNHSNSSINYVFIQHDDGTAAFYAHLKLHDIAVQEYDRVAQGQFIALSGISGTILAHLHFGVYQSWPIRDGYDVPVNFRNASGPLDARGGLIEGASYLALPF
jgi:murein DD-endopeptidase MepM/ murein hydrolase activator NlpD